MNEAGNSPARAVRLRLSLALAGIASVGLGIWIVRSNADGVSAAATAGRGLHAPDFALLLAQQPIVVAHVLFAVAALALGPVMLLSRKGAAFHRKAGWTWVALMAATALTSFLMLDEGYSYIHVMSGVTLLLLPLAVHAARRHAVARHRALMMWLFYVMLVGAAAFTLVPGRLIWRMFFG